jgi:hypothetical protein
MTLVRWRCEGVMGYKRVTPAPTSPLWGSKGATLPFFTHTCHPHYAHQRSLDSPGLLHSVDCPLYIPLFLSFVPRANIAVMAICSPCPCFVSCPFSIKCSLPVLASRFQRLSLQNTSFSPCIYESSQFNSNTLNI